METVSHDRQVTVIDKSIEVFKGGSQILLSHQARSSKALKVAQSILSQWDQAYAIEDPEKRREALAIVDQRSNDFLAKCGMAVNEMQESRKAITQLMDMIKKMYTEEENKLDPKKGVVPASIQLKRNQYAKEHVEEQERIRMEAEKKAAKAKEEIEIRTYIKNQIASLLIDFLSKKKLSVTNHFNAITLDDFEEKSAKLKLMTTAFPLEKLPEILKLSKPFYSKHTDQEFLSIQLSENERYDFPAFYNEYYRQMKDLKLSLIDRLPSKQQELQEQKRIADEAEALRLAELEKQKEAEKIRQEQIEKANVQEKKKLEEQARIQREQEAVRMEQLDREAEERRLSAEKEQKLREEQENLRIQQEAFDAKQKAEQEGDLQKAAGTAQLLFDQSIESSIASPAPEARSGFDITVLHPAGFVEIFQFWFQREGCKMSPDEMGKKTLNQMKTFAEACAKKDDTRIESKYLKYETSIKSVNRKSVGGK